jgi:hypothetical protein
VFEINLYDPAGDFLGGHKIALAHAGIPGFQNGYLGRMPAVNFKSTVKAFDGNRINIAFKNNARGCHDG